MDNDRQDDIAGTEGEGAEEAVLHLASHYPIEAATVVQVEAAADSYNIPVRKPWMEPCRRARPRKEGCKIDTSF